MAENKSLLGAANQAEEMHRKNSKVVPTGVPGGVPTGPGSAQKSYLEDTQRGQEAKALEQGVETGAQIRLDHARVKTEDAIQKIQGKMAEEQELRNQASDFRTPWQRLFGKKSQG